MPHSLVGTSIWEAAFEQGVFRGLLHAVSYPGTIMSLLLETDPWPAYLAVLATVADRATSLADANQLLDESAWRFLGARMTDPAVADFVVADGTQPPLPGFRVRLGEIERPDLGATLVLAGNTPHFVSDGCVRFVSLTGPGLAQIRTVCTAGFHSDWFHWRNAQVLRFPLGVDVILAARRDICFIPRTTSLNILQEPAWAT